MPQPLCRPSYLAELKEQAERNRKRILQFLFVLGCISQRFAEEGIQLCSVKGPLLAQRLFGDASLRTSRDLDLLTHSEVMAQAEALLLVQWLFSASIPESL